MRALVSVTVFAGSLALLTIACTLGWGAFISDRLYSCTDSIPFDFLHPGHWVHSPVTVERVVAARSMSEPDTIKSGWSTARLWLLWCFFAGGSVLISLLLARLPWNRSGQRKRIGAHANAFP